MGNEGRGGRILLASSIRLQRKNKLNKVREYWKKKENNGIIQVKVRKLLIIGGNV